MNAPDLPMLLCGVALIFGSGVTVGWRLGRRVTRYMLGGRL
jgi:hypothetical protein